MHIGKAMHFKKYILDFDLVHSLDLVQRRVRGNLAAPVKAIGVCPRPGSFGNEASVYIKFFLDCWDSLPSKGAPFLQKKSLTCHLFPQ